MLLRDLPVLVLDCQASGATPAHGDLLEIGWAVTRHDALLTPVRAYWVTPTSGRAVSRAVRRLTGWSERCLDDAVDPEHAWRLLRADVEASAARAGHPVPTAIHFARFETPFLRALHERAGDDPFPLDTVCLHAIAERLFPDLPRRNLRALSGMLGHSPELVRRSAGHVEASAFVWRALVPRLAERGLTSWSDLRAWLAEKTPRAPRGRASQRGFPLARDKRRALPDRPGVYRFLRSNGDILYVGKAASLKKRVSSHYTGSSRATERALEMLSQAHDVQVTETASALEAALLEADEIKRLDPPYNVQLRLADRGVFFASADWGSVAGAPDDVHTVGPLPSRGAISGLSAIRALLSGAPTEDERVRAAAVGVPRIFAPPRQLFDGVWPELVRDHLSGTEPLRTRILRAGATIVPSDGDEDSSTSEWDAPALRRHLERVLHSGALVVRRATWLALLADATVAFQEPGAAKARVLRIAGGEIVMRDDLDDVDVIRQTRLAPPPPRRARQATFDPARYDRLRVLSTELRRVVESGGRVVVRVGAHVQSWIRRSPIFVPSPSV